mgnify:CR=1 FL=1
MDLIIQTMQKFVTNVEFACMKVEVYSAQINTTIHAGGFVENVERKICLPIAPVIHAEQKKVVGFKYSFHDKNNIYM